MDIVSDLADPLHSSFALFEPRWVPWQVDVDLGTEPLKVEAFACRISRANEANISPLDRCLDLLAWPSDDLFHAARTRPRHRRRARPVHLER